VRAPTNAADWVALSDVDLPVGEALAWASVPSCGGVVVFCGTVRDHAEGRQGVTGLSYEAYEEQAQRKMEAVVAAARDLVPDLGRIAVWHRVGDLAVGDVAVCVVASAPHRAEAFEAARVCIDAVKETVPIWKQERWGDGEVDWGTCAHDLREPVSR
jgi:molybdopterin synthase catalytic subunit